MGRRIDEKRIWYSDSAVGVYIDKASICINSDLFKETSRKLVELNNIGEVSLVPITPNGLYRYGSSTLIRLTFAPRHGEHCPLGGTIEATAESKEVLDDISRKLGLPIEKAPTTRIEVPQKPTEAAL